MFDLEKFKTGKYYVHLPTQELYDEAMEFLDESVYLWRNGNYMKDINYWEINGHTTGISYYLIDERVTRGDLDYFKNDTDCEELPINKNSIIIGNLIDGNIKIEKTPNFNSSVKDCIISHQHQDNKHNDLVKSPNHYIGNYGLEVEEVLRNFIPRYEDSYVAHRIASALEYLLRSPLKNGKQDLEKARYNITQALEHMDKNE